MASLFWRSVFLERGFTLVELIIAVAIIATLASLAIPQINEYRAKSNDTTALVDVKNSAILLRTNMKD